MNVQVVRYLFCQVYIMCEIKINASDICVNRAQSFASAVPFLTFVQI